MITWTDDVARLDEFDLWEHNPKTMTKARADRLAANWKELGQWQTLAIGPNGECYDGHQRIKTLLAEGYPGDFEIAVRRASRPLTEEERLRIVIEGSIGTVGSLNWDVIPAFDEEQLQRYGFDDEAADDWTNNAANYAAWQAAQEEEPPEDPGAQIDQGEELREKWGVETGQLWQLGEHRIVCGDCTDAAVVARVMDGEKAALVVTDPPYGVGYADKNTFLNSIDKGNHIQSEIKNDHESKEVTQALWRVAFKQTEIAMRAGAVIYCFMPQGGDQMMMMMMMEGAGIEPRHELIWLKNNHVLGRVDYAYKHEPILYAWKKGGHRFYGDFQTSILEFDKPVKSKFHPTMKPVGLIERLVTNSSELNGIVYDPFLGSGTTLIACERLNRKCRGVEIAPKYVAVTIQRWVDMTGGEPVLVQ